MQQKTIFLKVSFLFVLCFVLYGCKTVKEIDAFQCIMIQNDASGNKNTLDKWYWYCFNQKTKEEKSIWLKDSDKCISSSGDCKWYGTDINEIEKVKKFLKDNNQCN